MKSILENSGIETHKIILSQAFRVKFSGAIPQLAALIIAIFGLTVLAGWIFSIPLLKSIIPGAVQMKANTAVGLVAAACSLFILSDRSSQSQQRLAQILAIAVAALGLATLSQYLFGWQLGIDELLFRDTADAYNIIRGRMSPFTAFTFIIIGLTLVALTSQPMQQLARLTSILVIAIGAIVCLGYMWHASELTTDSWLPPVAVNTGFAFAILGIGMLRTCWVHDHKKAAITSVEIKILIGLISALLLLVMAGGYTYRTGADYVDTSKRISTIQQVRAELGELYRVILEVESIQRNYLLTGNQAYKSDYKHFIDELSDQKQILVRHLIDNPEQMKNFAELEPLVAHRVNLLTHQLFILEHQSPTAVKAAISSDDGIQTMQSIRTQIKRMDTLETTLLSMDEVSLTHNRELTLFALVATLALATGIFVVLFLGIRMEIVTRSQVEKLLIQAKEKAELANRAKDSFLATMSHEIRTPLTGMLGMLELLSLTKIDTEQRATLIAAWDSGRGLLRIVNDILDWSKIEEGKLELSLSSTSIPQLLQEVVNTYSRVASAKSLIILLHADARLSSAHLVDPLRLSQVLNNFVSNAIKFTQRGEIELRAELLEHLDSAERIRFSVKDTGLGIAKEVQNKLFQRYQQESAETARMYGGTGLGLSICRRLAELMGGLIELKSEQGLGSIFSITLTLPVSRDPVKSMQNLHPEVEQRAVIPLFTNGIGAPMILAVDDTPTNRDLLARQLKMLGLRVETAGNGEIALSNWRDGKYALVITDCHMPDMDGYELTREIRKIETRESRPRTPIIAWTANALSEESGRCQAAGMDDLLVKPTDMMQLRRTLAKWLSIPETDNIQPVTFQAANKPNQSPIDYSVLNMIVSNPAEQVQLLHDFHSHIQSDYTNLIEMLTQDDPAMVEDTAHRMKGSSRMVGAQTLAVVCENIERAAKNADLAGARESEKALKDAIQKLSSYLVEAGVLKGKS